MVFLRILSFFALALVLSNCRKKSESAGEDVREAGYAMTSGGWFQAVEADDAAVMKRMVEGGFDHNTRDPEGNLALNVAAGAGARGAAEYLLNLGHSVDERGGNESTPLMAAVRADHPEMVKWLLRQGADPNLKDRDGYMALMVAAGEGKPASVEELAPYHRGELDSALLLASMVGDAKVIDVLTNYGASVYARMEDGRTPLMLAAENGHREAAALLIDIGASRFSATEAGDTAQSLAVAAGHTDIAKLIESGFEGDGLVFESDPEVADMLASEVRQGSPGEAAVSPEDLEDGDLSENSGGSRDLPAARSGGGVEGGKPSRGKRFSGSGGVKDRVPASLEGATVGTSPVAESAGGAEEQAPGLALVMRRYRQRELPIEVKSVSGGVATLRIAGADPQEIEVRGGDAIPGSKLLVVKVFNRSEQGKLNDSRPMELGIIEVEDTASGIRREWIAGRPASGHDPVALVEDGSTGLRYVAKPGQKFTSGDGREYVVGDVRPGQLVIEDTASGEVRTLRLRGPKG